MSAKNHLKIFGPSMSRFICFLKSLCNFHCLDRLICKELVCRTRICYREIATSNYGSKMEDVIPLSKICQHWLKRSGLIIRVNKHSFKTVNFTTILELGSLILKLTSIPTIRQKCMRNNPKYDQKVFPSDYLLEYEYLIFILFDVLIIFN